MHAVFITEYPFQMLSHRTRQAVAWLHGAQPEVDEARLNILHSEASHVGAVCASYWPQA